MGDPRFGDGGSSGGDPRFGGGGGGGGRPTSTTRPLSEVEKNVRQLNKTSGGATPSVRQVRRKTKKAKRKLAEAGPEGILGQFGDLVSSLPSGLANTAVAAGEELAVKPWENLAEGVSEGSPWKVAKGLPGIGTSLNLAEGTVQGFTGDEGAVEDHPLSAMQGGSFRNTYEDVIHPTRFVRAYNDGQILGKLVEDAANLSLVAGGAKAGLNLASKGAFAEAQTASATAKAAERAVAPIEREAAQAARQATEHADAVVKLRGLMDEVPRAEKIRLQSQLGQAESVARDSAQKAIDAGNALEGYREAARVSRAAADEAVKQASGPLYQAYRIAHHAANLTGQGANLPAKPFELAAKGFSEVATKFLGANPALRESLAAADQALGEALALQKGPVRRAILKARRAGVKLAEVAQNRADRKTMAGRISGIESAAAHDALRVGRTLDAIERIAGDDVTWQTAALSRSGIGAAIVDSVRALGSQPQFGERLNAVLDELAGKLHMDRQALEHAIDIADGSADPALAQRVGVINAKWDQEIRPWLEENLRTGEGNRRAMTDEQRAYADWQLTKSPDLPPGVVSRLRRLEEIEGARRETALTDAQKRVEKAAEKAGVTPGVKGTAAVNEAAAASVEGARPRLGALRDVQAQARSEGRAAASRSAASRIETVREAIPGQVDDAVVGRLVDAADRFRRSTEELHTAQAEAAVATPGAAPKPAELIARIRDVRGTVVDVATQELGVLNDTLPATSLPFIPGDLSEYHAALHEAIGQREVNVMPTYERMRQSPANKRLTDADVFVKAYRSVAKKLKGGLGELEVLDDAAVRRLFEQHRAGTLSEMAGGLDTLAESYLGQRASGVPAEDVGALIDAYGRKGQIESFLKSARSNRWGDHMPDLLRAVIHDPEVARLLDDPVVDLALRAQRLDSAAEGLAALDVEAQTRPVELPDPGRLDAELTHANIDDPIDVFSAIERASDPETAAALYDRWQAAGEPVLDDALIAMTEGRAPEWANGQAPVEGVAAAEGAGAAPNGLEALRGAEEARSEIEGVLASQGGQGVSEALGREAGLLKAGAARSEEAAAKREGAVERAQAELTEAGAKKGVKGGKKLARYEKALRELGVAQKAVDEMPEWMPRAIEQLYRGITEVPLDERALTVKQARKAGLDSGVLNAPAHARPALIVAKDFTKAITTWRAELVEKGVPADLLAPFDEALRLAIDDIRDIYGGKVQMPDGTLVDAPARFETDYVPGGQPLRRAEEAIGRTSRARPEARPVVASLAPEERLKATAQLPRSVDEMRVVLRERIMKHTRNQAARMVASLYGRRAEGVLGDIEGLDDAQVAQAMAAEGYVPWNPEAVIQGRRNARELGGPGTLWLPEHIERAVNNYYGQAGGLEKFMRTFYDKPITFWKAAVLALRPAWHVNNILSNALMAMVGSGMGPLEYARRMRQSYALLRVGDQALDVALPEGVVRTGPMSARRLARATSPERLARLRRTVGTIEPDTIEALGGIDNIGAPGRIVEGGAGAAMTQPGELATVLDNPGRLRRFVDKSYELNGAIDDMNRLAVFLEARGKLTKADLNNLVARNPELASLSPGQLRSEGAIRLSLRVAGDFLRMTPIERRVFRRIFPFYVWMRHITGLTGHLVAYHPLRVAWGLHLAQMMGQPSEFGLASALPLGPNSVLQLPNAVPFGDASAPTPDEVGFNLSPIAKLGAGALFGIDLNRMTQFQRPPGQPGGYGGDPGMTPLIGTGGVRLGELANLFGAQFPQTRVVRGITDSINSHLPSQLKGEDTGDRPVRRYPLGQVRRSSKTAGRKPYKSGDPMLGPLARYLGLPFERQPAEPYEKSDVAQMLAEMKRRRRTAGRR